MQEKEQDQKKEQNQGKEQNKEKEQARPKRQDQATEPDQNQTGATVSRAEYDRLLLELTAERLLAVAGAKNLTAAKALLDWQGLDVGRADWQASLERQVQELRRRPDSAFLFARKMQAADDCRWLGLEPAAAGDTADIYGGDGGYAFRLAQAEGVEAIKIKQEAAANGIII